MGTPIHDASHPYNHPSRPAATSSNPRSSVPDTDTSTPGWPLHASVSSASNRPIRSDTSPQDAEWPLSTTNVTTSTSPRESQTSLNTRAPTISSLTSTALSIPQIRVNQSFQPDSDSKTWFNPTLERSSSSTSVPRRQFQEKDKHVDGLSSHPQDFSLNIDIPLGGFAEDLSDNTFEFSNRGSMLIDGKRLNNTVRASTTLTPIMDDETKVAIEATAQQSQHPPPDTPYQQPQDHPLNTPYQHPQDPPPATSSAAPSRPVTTSSSHEKPVARPLTTEEEILSERVRAFYTAGTDEPHPTSSNTNLAAQMGGRWQATLTTDLHGGSIPSLSRATSTTDMNEDNVSSRKPSVAPSGSGPLSLPHDREELELAGGLEDWKDVDNADVDRYGFILARAPTTSTAPQTADASKAQKLTRVSTSLQLASETPRRKNTLRRAPSSAHGSIKSNFSRHSTSNPDQTPTRPTSSQSAYARSSLGRRSTSSRVPLPGSKTRRLMETAGNMLTLPNTAHSVIENGHIHVDDARAKRKEIEREEKWRRMARPLPKKIDPKTGLPIVGGGSSTTSAFTFDTTSPKVVERTWKGIPDKWRATAWHSFLSSSASKHKDSLPDDVLIESFHQLQSQPSPDDVQIDIDVPRTISSHIMFRRRYRGGQRLLFRVLHAMSLHFSETGYVQGMAALAVTLLAYYDEELTFVMLVRMWQLRGLEELYRAGFGGLMSALNDFETLWLGKGEVGKKLDDLNITPTAYGTRWYLTLFNYTMPFPAQLRVWDVFMLLGDDTSRLPTPNPSSLRPSKASDNNDGLYDFGTTLDVLHATSAALIDGMRDILLASDFENAMKVLTSWVPIQDPDLLMRIARAEWKMHLKKQGTSR
ncbi:hypothetical protein PV10_02495 [Exophiala mesophila]|uniref:Rab-GAP TBC domain-containing protein n=1 Tax=Exophiala mesophila TaxID=212818 RepID=A0A0D2A6V9_EXOME|nr:uncharacterized protein PV10_02495 [Exophiala mesophila]KIV94763.1 hypothetical protein PV10_02495 [Exophiala mesophila]